MNISAVFVTFNRKETALHCVARLRSQSRRPDRLIVVDGGSTDGSREALRKVLVDYASGELIEIPGNPGNAAGMAEAMKRAVENGADAVWLLDDDSWPRPDALERLLAGWRPKEREVAGSLVLTPDTGELSWPVLLIGEDGSRYLAENLDDVPRDRPTEVRGIWLGALIPAAAICEIGTPHPGLFIRGEDEEYPARLGLAGYRFRLVPDSILEHPKPGELRRLTIAGRHYYHETQLAPWKSYYLLRNRIYCRRLFAESTSRGILNALVLSALGVGLPLLLEDRKLERLGLHLRAVRDGWTGRLGKQVPPPTSA